MAIISTFLGTEVLQKSFYHGGFRIEKHQCQQHLPKLNKKNINTMIIIMDSVVFRLLLTLLALALKTENEKNIRLCGKKTGGSFHINLFIILMLHQNRLIPLAQFIRHSIKS